LQLRGLFSRASCGFVSRRLDLAFNDGSQRRKQTPRWQNTTVLPGDVVEEISKLKDETAGVILVAGSGTLVATLLAADLVDELRLMVFPTILGRGRRLFPDGIDRLKLTLAESRTVGPDGVQIQTYERGE
jgi:dihydrofolate reductase